MHLTTEQLYSCRRCTCSETSAANSLQRADCTVSTAKCSRTQTEVGTFHLHADMMSEGPSGNWSSRFDGDTISSINTTDGNLFDFLNTAMNTSTEPGFMEASATDEPSQTSTDPPEPEYNSSTQPLGIKSSRDG